MSQSSGTGILKCTYVIVLFITKLPDIEKAVSDKGWKILTPLVSLDTPGKATVEVVILADPVRK